jgi:hypothetical protein
MSTLHSLIALAIVLSVIAFLGHMTFKSALTSDASSWFIATMFFYLLAMTSGYIYGQTLVLLIYLGPIAFIFGFTYQVARQTIKKHFT